MEIAMENDLAEIEERQDLLEAHLGALEARIDGQELMLDLAGARMGPAARSSPAQGPAGSADSGDASFGIQNVESLMRSIASNQSMHTMTLRILSRSQESWQVSLRGSVDTAVSKLDSIMKSLQRVDRDLRAHIERQGTGA
jgi:hypothetical protein